MVIGTLMRRYRLLFFLLGVSVQSSLLPAQSQDVVLRGTITGRQNQTYLAIPFQVPEKTNRLTVTFEYTGREQKTALDLGVFDPERFRGWSGGNKSGFTISPTDATPSYLEGPLPAGTWRLIVGIPNIRSNTVAHYTARVRFTPAAAPGMASFTSVPLKAAAGWYRGDLHMHTAHSDGSCLSQSGIQVPCPLFLTVQAAANRELDFIAITDHNTISQYDDERELQPFFDKLLLIPGREMTTFQGHANVFGTMRFLDFRVGTPDVVDENIWMRQAEADGAIVSLNHPNAPSGEICMGCGWLASPVADMKLVTAVEAVNAGVSEGTYAGIAFWERQLNAGFHLTGIGGSDNHNATKPAHEPGAVGSPTTVVYAQELSVQGILAGIRSGRVFVDLTGSRDRLIEVAARSSGKTVATGGSLHVLAGSPVDISVHTAGCAGSRIEAKIDGHDEIALPAQVISSDDAVTHFRLASPVTTHWIRFDVRSADGKLQLLGNPVYLEQ